MLSILYGVFFLNLIYFEEDYFLLYMFAIAACEGALGLSLIVSLIRSHGGDFFFSINLIQC
jgi:NADH-ubiquinone oxidoreductase chain 4L